MIDDEDNDKQPVPWLDPASDAPPGARELLRHLRKPQPMTDAQLAEAKESLRLALEARRPPRPVRPTAWAVPMGAAAGLLLLLFATWQWGRSGGGPFAKWAHKDPPVRYTMTSDPQAPRPPPPAPSP